MTNIVYMTGQPIEPEAIEDAQAIPGPQVEVIILSPSTPTPADLVAQVILGALVGFGIVGIFLLLL